MYKSSSGVNRVGRNHAWVNTDSQEILWSALGSTLQYVKSEILVTLSNNVNESVTRQIHGIAIVNAWGCGNTFGFH